MLIKKVDRDIYDVIIIGAGHAGVEAAFACAKLNKKTLIVTLDANKIALTPCNPSIGGSAKGIVVNEIDALGGMMAMFSDQACLQLKVLNKTKGPAVRSLRAQIDKEVYPKVVRDHVIAEPNIDLLEDMVIDLLVENNALIGISTQDNGQIKCRKAILTTGTYMQAICMKGDEKVVSGPNGSKTTSKLSEELKKHGLALFRLKTGTPPRVDKKSIDFSNLEIEPGDPDFNFTFSKFSKSRQKIDLNCWLTYTNEKTHQLIRDNLLESAAFSTKDIGRGPRYCPSIEDKVVRFADKMRHQIFLEPESYYNDSIYVQGFSTSFSEKMQDILIRTIPGLENCKVLKWGYAIEYDAIKPTELKPTLELKKIKNLYSAGQINGTSGYEEAGSQGFWAGVNAAISIDEPEREFILKRTEAHLGVMIDDLVTKGTEEPYRLLTSRAEHRLYLRTDNAYERLSKIGYEIGTLSKEKYDFIQQEQKQIDAVMDFLQKTTTNQNSNFAKLLLKEYDYTVKDKITLEKIIETPIIKITFFQDHYPELKEYSEDILNRAEIKVKYRGYLEKEDRQIQKINNLENKLIPKNINYDLAIQISTEGREKLKKIRPLNIGQASRISGISASDIFQLVLFLKK